MTDLDEALAGTTPATEMATSTATVRKCRRHDYELRTVVTPDDVTTESRCWRCGTLRDIARSKRGKSARNRGNQFERDVAKRLGVKRVGQYGGADDVRGEWISVQCKVGGAYPERIDGWLRAIPATAEQLRAVVIGDAPGIGGRRRVLVVLDFGDFVDWFGSRGEAA